MLIRRTKLIATIGPACDSPEILKSMIEAGMNVARLNFSHGSPAEHLARIERVREAAQQVGGNVAIMVDTKGIEIRVGRIEGDAAVLSRGDAFDLYTSDRVGNAAGVAVTYGGLAEALSPGQRVLLDDGKIELRVESILGERIRCRVECGGTLRSRKGVNIPDTQIVRGALDPESHEDLAFAAENEVEYVAASFVQTAEDIETIRAYLEGRGADIPIIAKIENRVGVAHLEEIVAAANGTMVARGDLGVELPMAEVPVIQKRIIRTTVSAGKPVITATQMLDSMERNPRPTRAEVSDVANAILDGTSAVMLSGETAAGAYPVESVSTMADLALQAERALPEFGTLQNIHPQSSNVITEAVSQAAITMSDHLEASAILALTETGFTSRMISKYRPGCPILAITSSEAVVRKLAMNWGIIPLRYEGESNDEARIEFAIDRALALGIVKKGDVVVATAGRSQMAGGTDLIRVVPVDR